ncbi:MAG: nucleotidyltransferase domain-containing protein [Oscillospiraceae bacterium]|nr:nucleotidyltransferase domain-containing protein [Oscillospiraceae bacterium]
MEFDEKIQKELDLIKESILKTVPAEEIYLFGSYAYGTPHKDSDLDIYVVVPDSVQRKPLDVAVEIRDSLYKKINMPMDLQIGKHSVFHRRKEGPTIQRTVAQRGVKLYG